jgi:hypothetical protein
VWIASPVIPSLSYSLSKYITNIEYHVWVGKIMLWIKNVLLSKKNTPPTKGFDRKNKLKMVNGGWWNHRLFIVKNDVF